MSRHIDTRQRQAGAIMFLVCDITKYFLKKWYNLCCNYNLLDDSESISPNCEYFKEHRHDQSIFSLLTKKYNIYSIRSLFYGIEYSRNNTGDSTIQ